MASLRDDGFATPVEMMFLLAFCVVSMAFVGFLGRLHAAGVDVTTVAHVAAREASMAATPAEAATVAATAVRSSALSTRCRGGAVASTTWTASPLRTWQGGSVTVTIRCTVSNSSLAGWWTPGARTVVMSDTQPVDRYHR